MSKFHYQAYGAGGTLAEGSIEAASSDHARATLHRQGLMPFHLENEQTATPWWQREVFAGRQSLSRQLPVFTRDLATLVDADIPIDSALRMLAKHAVTRATRQLAADLLADVVDGAALSVAMQRHPKTFAADYVSIVRAGEIGGTMAKVLQELADLLEHRRETLAQVQSALIYPSIVALASLMTLSIVLTVLVPSIASIFAESGRALPPAVAFLAALRARGPELLAAAGLVALALAAAAAMAQRRQGFARRVDRWKLRIPLLGALLQSQDTARFSRTLGTLLRAGVPLVQAMQIAGDALRNRHQAAGLQRANALVREGSSMARVLGAEAALPPMAVQMIGVGEEAGNLDRVLLQIAGTFERQARRATERFITVLAPAITLLMAAAVGALLTTVMSAILSINDLAMP